MRYIILVLMLLTVGCSEERGGVVINKYHTGSGEGIVETVVPIRTGGVTAFVPIQYPTSKGQYMITVLRNGREQTFSVKEDDYNRATVGGTWK